MLRLLAPAAVACARLSHLVLAQETAHPATTQPECARRYQDTRYVSWVCDTDGKEYSDTVILFFVRVAQSGATVGHRVWSGSLAGLADQISGLVESHQSQTADCAAYFHMAAVDASGGVQWNRVTGNMQNWWKDDGAKDFPRLCHSAEPRAADYVVFWTDSSRTIPYTFALPVPQTSYPGLPFWPPGSAPLYTDPFPAGPDFFVARYSSSQFPSAQAASSVERDFQEAVERELKGLVFFFTHRVSPPVVAFIASEGP